MINRHTQYPHEKQRKSEIKMLTRDQPCFHHPTKVTFTFAEQDLKDSPVNNGNCPSFWTPGSPYRDKDSYNMQKWLAMKMKGQKDKLKLERAVSRAEKKLQLEYDKQMEEKRKAAEDRFKAWLKVKGFANQSPVMLHRHHHSCLDTQTPLTPALTGQQLTDTSSTFPSGGTPRRPRTARVKSGESGDVTDRNVKTRPRSAAGAATTRKHRITSTLDPSKQLKQSKSLGQNDYMKMRHFAGKRYRKMKEEQAEFQCEDQLLRKLQNLDWEEKCIKKKMVFSEKENLDKLRKKALRKKKKKMKFKGDVITVEVEELDNADDVEITFEEVDDQCSDIGCIEKEGVDFHIESRETIDLSDKPEEITRPATAEPPQRPTTSKQRKQSPKQVAVKVGAVKKDSKEATAAVKESGPKTSKTEKEEVTKKNSAKKENEPKSSTTEEKILAEKNILEKDIESKKRSIDEKKVVKKGITEKENEVKKSSTDKANDVKESSTEKVKTAGKKIESVPKIVVDNAAVVKSEPANSDKKSSEKAEVLNKKTEEKTQNAIKKSEITAKKPDKPGISSPKPEIATPKPDSPEKIVKDVAKSETVPKISAGTEKSTKKDTDSLEVKSKTLPSKNDKSKDTVTSDKNIAESLESHKMTNGELKPDSKCVKHETNGSQSVDKIVKEKAQKEIPKIAEDTFFD